MEVALHRPVEVNAAPHLVNVLGQVARAHVIVGILHAVLGDEDRQVGIGPHRPFERVEKAFGDVGNEIVFAEIRVRGEARMCEQFLRFEGVE